MRPRNFIAGLSSTTAAWPLVARAQPPAMALIGILGRGFPTSSAIFVDAFKQGMADNGLVEGRDYVLDVRWAEGDYTRFAALAADLAQRKPKVILISTIPAGRIAQQLAPTIPLVMAGLIDPVGAGLIASLARPGNNTTGIFNMAQDMTAKRLELLRTVVPTIKMVAVLFNPANPGNRLIMEDVRNKAAILGVMVRPIEFKGPDTLDTTIEAATGNDAFLMIGDAALIDLRAPIAALTLRHRLPTVSSIPEFTDAGALIGYGPSRRVFYKRAATYVKRVLDGAKPSDLPVEQPTEIELSINLRTAKALGLVFPDTLIARADRVIE
jgi:putative tryptophan/tyrosine transport system substrate-binding protein